MVLVRAARGSSRGEVCARGRGGVLARATRRSATPPMAPSRLALALARTPPRPRVDGSARELTHDRALRLLDGGPAGARTSADAGERMSFVSFTFALFFAIVMALRVVLDRTGSHRAWIAFLIGASLVFYAWNAPWHVLLLGAVAVMGYVAGRVIGAAPAGARR